jgi:hypothetical protein
MNTDKHGSNPRTGRIDYLSVQSGTNFRIFEQKLTKETKARRTAKSKWPSLTSFASVQTDRGSESVRPEFRVFRLPSPNPCPSVQSVVKLRIFEPKLTKETKARTSGEAEMAFVNVVRFCSNGSRIGMPRGRLLCFPCVPWANSESVSIRVHPWLKTFSEFCS